MEQGHIPGDDQRAWWLALLRAPGIGGATALRLLGELGAPDRIFACSPSALRALGLGEETAAYLRSPDWRGVDQDQRWLAEPGHHLLTIDSPGYPPLLRQIPDPPLALFISGDPAVLGSAQLAIVGSRNPTSAGREIARELSVQLVQLGLTITSGLAAGIDAAAHRGAIDGGGRTIAVLGTGPDRVYPAEHRALAGAIADHGALVSEFPAGVPPLAANFPRRNRIISGLSAGVLVIEATLRSGSLITAGHGLEQGREVFAVPGSIRNPQARGCHALLKQGAKLVESVADIMEELGALADAARSQAPVPKASRSAEDELGAQERDLLEQMGYDPVTVDMLIERTGLTAEVVSSMLLLLELRGRVTAQPGGIYIRSQRVSP
jgi:DNA processing protein